ncbi:MAG: hypothetical protein NTX36_01560 [Proteobacteria bacterium]|nr:hypothetical protein [Pseudomonadota bacterium]
MKFRLLSGREISLRCERSGEHRAESVEWVAAGLSCQGVVAFLGQGFSLRGRSRIRNPYGLILPKAGQSKMGWGKVSSNSVIVFSLAN